MSTSESLSEIKVTLVDLATMIGTIDYLICCDEHDDVILKHMDDVRVVIGTLIGRVDKAEKTHQQMMDGMLHRLRFIVSRFGRDGEFEDAKDDS